MSHDNSGHAIAEVGGNDVTVNQTGGGVLQPSDEEIPMKKMVWQEATRVAKLFAFLYAVIFICLVYYRRNARSYYEDDYKRKLSRLENSNRTPQVQPWWIIHEKRIEEINVKIHDLKKVQEEKLAKVKHTLHTVEAMKTALDELDFTVESTDKHARSSERLVYLLERAALAEIPSAIDLEQLLTEAAADLQAIVMSPNDVDWAHLETSLSARFPERVPSAPVNGVALECPLVYDGEGASPVVPEAAARMSELEAHVKVVFDVFDKRARLVAGGGLVDALLSETGGRLEESARQVIIEALDALVASLASRRSADDVRTTSSCVRKEEVLEIVEEGLLALQRRADLRNALRRKVIELDPSATSIILDADLPAPKPKISPHDTTNLRRVLETPLLMKLAVGIDIIVEMAGGHNDRLDQWLDSFATGRESVGELMVRRLLEVSGKVEIPTIETAKSRLPIQAQEFVKKASTIFSL